MKVSLLCLPLILLVPCPLPTTFTIFFFLFLNLKKSLIFRERERETSICCPTYLCTDWLILACALTRVWTCILGASGWCSNQLSYQARTLVSLYSFRLSLGRCLCIIVFFPFFMQKLALGSPLFSTFSLAHPHTVFSFNVSLVYLGNLSRSVVYEELLLKKQNQTKPKKHLNNIPFNGCIII